MQIKSLTFVNSQSFERIRIEAMGITGWSLRTLLQAVPMSHSMKIHCEQNCGDNRAKHQETLH